MSSTLSPDSPAGIFSTDKIGGFGFGYGIAVSVGILLLITTITLASYYCTRNNTSLPDGVHQHRSHHHRRFTANSSVSASADIESGIDEVTLMSYPKLLYSDAKSSSVNAAAVSCCSICLADYKEKDEVRQLPECGHVFHVWCVDPWLRLRPTCPLCRTSPLPSPLPTPLQEVVPLATR